MDYNQLPPPPGHSYQPPAQPDLPSIDFPPVKGPPKKSKKKWVAISGLAILFLIFVAAVGSTTPVSNNVAAPQITSSPVSANSKPSSTPSPKATVTEKVTERVTERVTPTPSYTPPPPTRTVTPAEWADRLGSYVQAVIEAGNEGGSATTPGEILSACIHQAEAAKRELGALRPAPPEFETAVRYMENADHDYMTAGEECASGDLISAEAHITSGTSWVKLSTEALKHPSY